MNPNQAALRYWLDPLPVDQLPLIAAQWVAEGNDDPNILATAIADRHTDPRDIRESFVAALKAQDAWILTRDAAEERFVRCLARDLTNTTRTLEDTARLFRRYIDFDSVAYSPHPKAVTEFMALCWLHGGGEYQRNGGDQRLLETARQSAQRPSADT